VSKLHAQPMHMSRNLVCHRPNLHSDPISSTPCLLLVLSLSLSFAQSSLHHALFFRAGSGHQQFDVCSDPKRPVWAVSEHLQLTRTARNLSPRPTTTTTTAQPQLKPEYFFFFFFVSCSNGSQEWHAWRSAGVPRSGLSV